jgi:Zn-dependent peptidase ImmA (M78 family)
MRVPKKINVLGCTYKIIVKRTRITLNGMECDGLTDINKKEIWLSGDLKGDRLKKVYSHELGHAFLHQSGFWYFLESQAEELFCEAFANFITQSVK